MPFERKKYNKLWWNAFYNVHVKSTVFTWFFRFEGQNERFFSRVRKYLIMKKTYSSFKTAFLTALLKCEKIISKMK